MNVKPSKVMPIMFPPSKRNNYVTQKSIVVQNLKCLIFVETFLAINRIYLFHCRKFLLFLSYMYCITLSVFTTFFAFQTETLTVAHFIFKYSLCTEYILLVLTSITANKNKLLRFFKNLNSFDNILNITKDIVVIDSAYRSILWLSGCVLFHFIEYVLLKIYLAFFLDSSLYFIYIMTIAHDCEQIFFFILLRNIYMRLLVVKAHVSKVFCADESSSCIDKFSKVEALSNNARLDVSSLHRVYDLLHNCSEQLNSLMSLPMILVILTSGLSSIMLMKMAVSAVQLMTANTLNDSLAFCVPKAIEWTCLLRLRFKPSAKLAKSTVIYLLARCCKYTVLIVIPCYYSSITTTQVSRIRTLLHDAIHTTSLDKIERRKVKAFFQLTRENEFSYALGGVIRLNMSLPLSYMSLCTTYLVISIQFAKFFD